MGANQQPCELILIRLLALVEAYYRSSAAC
jgi:hypothetical protein